jgi:hypothetical protein
VDGFAARYNGDGTPDNSFGQGGIVNDNSGYINSLVIDPNGKIVLAGSIYRYDNNFLICKLQSNGHSTTVLMAVERFLFVWDKQMEQTHQELPYSRGI